jgi:phosphomevalonate kinase
MTFDNATVVSCPGKVLLAGGYLVLDRAHDGLVVATPSRFYTVVREDESQEPVQTEQEAQDSFRVWVSSPQFDDGEWEYEAKKTDGEWVVTAVQKEGFVRLFETISTVDLLIPAFFSRSSSNTFVHLSVQATLQVATALSPSASHRSLAVTIVGSNDFYSQSRTVRLVTLPPQLMYAN